MCEWVGGLGSAHLLVLECMYVCVCVWGGGHTLAPLPRYDALRNAPNPPPSATLTTQCV